MEVARHWRIRKQRYNLPDTSTPNGHYLLSSNGKAHSANGHSNTVITIEAEQAAEVAAPVTTGTIYSYTTVMSAPAGFDVQAPYTLALVEMDDGTKLTAQLTDLDGEPEIGMRVEMVTRKLRTDGDAGIIIYGYKFRESIR